MGDETTSTRVSSHIDHMIVTAPILATGVEYVADLLGIAPQAGGKHPRMGTHNAVLRLGPAAYLEVIAVDPGAGAPERARWFELDELAATAAPRLASWVARVTDIRSASHASPVALGNIEAMTRADLRWLITIPPDGVMPFGGIAPALIEWQTLPHPASAMLDRRCALRRLEGFHPRAAAVDAMLQSIGFEDCFTVREREEPRLVAEIETPAGVRRLGSA